MNEERKQTLFISFQIPGMVFLLYPFCGCFKKYSFKPKLYFHRGNNPKENICLFYLSLSSYPAQWRCFMSENIEHNPSSPPLPSLQYFQVLRLHRAFILFLKNRKKDKENVACSQPSFNTPRRISSFSSRFSELFPQVPAARKLRNAKSKQLSQLLAQLAWKIDCLWEKDEGVKREKLRDKKGTEVFTYRKKCCQILRCAKAWK